jgi:uncharacterized metal-binding protein
MAQYKAHVSFNILFALPAFLAAMVYFVHPTLNLLIIFALCFVYSTLFMNPDLDVANQIKLISIRGILTFPFRFYSFIFRHRGVSHSFLLGTITRVLWLGGFLLLILYCTDRLYFMKHSMHILKSRYFLYGMAGIFTSDFSHLILDKMKKH